MFENRVLRGICLLKRQEETAGAKPMARSFMI
jgi:hypothetical protein